MGPAVMDLPVSPVAQEMSYLIDHSRETAFLINRSKKIDEDIKNIYQGFELTNKTVLNAMTDWHEFLKRLEQKPENYKSMCRDGNVEGTITNLDKAGKTIRRESWVNLGETLRKDYKDYPDIYRTFKMVDENVEAFCALLQEVSWNLLILHRENQPSKGRSFSIDEAIEDLWS